MTEKTLNTRILLKYDSYENWTTKNPVLKAGEVAIATVPSNQDGIQNAPSVLMKVGDGSNPYNSLKFLSGLAADVHTWAKAEKKPTYEAGEITGIGDYIATYVDETLGISVDTDTQYRITKVDDYNYKLQSKAKGEADTAFIDVSTIVIPKYDDTEVKADIEALEGLVGTTAVATQIANAITALNLANTYERKGAADDALDEAKSYTDGKITDEATARETGVNEAKAAASKAQSEVDALETVVAGKADKATTLAGYGIGDAYTKTEVDSKLSSVYRYKGSVASYDALPTENITIGDVYNIEAADSQNGVNAGDNVAWNGTAWDVLAGTVDTSSFATKATTLEGYGITDAYTKTEVDANHTQLQSNIDVVSGELTALESQIHTVGKTGNVNDLVQTDGDVLIFNCGDSTNCGA